MDRHLASIARMWTTILVVYALTLGSLAPALAAADAVPFGGLCVSAPAGEAPGGEAPLHAADGMCCIVCAFAALPAPRHVPLATAPAFVVVPPARPSAVVEEPLAAAARPQSPRAPPVLA